MAQALSDNHIKLLKSATKVALGNACNALSNMFHDEVIVDNLEFYHGRTFQVHLNGVETVSTVFSKIIGDFTVNTYLLFDEDAAAKTSEALLPASMVGRKEMRKAILQELDNILVASLVTKYANLFNAKIHGHIPNLEEKNQEETLVYIENKNDKINTITSFEAEIIGFKSQLSLKLLFYFDQSFIETLEKFDRNKSHVGAEKDKKEGFFKKLFG